MHVGRQRPAGKEMTVASIETAGVGKHMGWGWLDWDACEGEGGVREGATACDVDTPGLAPPFVRRGLREQEQGSLGCGVLVQVNSEPPIFRHVGDC